MNICLFMGRLTRDPELEAVGGTNVLRFSIAVSRKYKTKDNQRAEEVNFLDLVAWDKGAETIAQYFKKGDPIIVRAAAKVEQWEKDGQRRSKVVFRVENFEFVPVVGKDNGDSEENEEAPAPRTRQRNSSPPPQSTGEDEIPF